MGIIELEKGSNIAMQNRIKETYWKIWIFKQEIYLEADTYKHLQGIYWKIWIKLYEQKVNR